MIDFFRLVDDDRGATAIEYGLIVALIAMAIIGSMGFVAEGTVGMWDFVSNTLDTAIES
jgi:pilus assembly protein Flp/PilA